MPRVSEMLPNNLSASGVMADDFAQMSDEEQAFLRSLAEDFLQMLEATEAEMAKRFSEQMFDLEEGNAFWSLLPAKVRTAIKRGGGK